MTFIRFFDAIGDKSLTIFSAEDTPPDIGETVYIHSGKNAGTYKVVRRDFGIQEDQNILVYTVDIMLTKK